MLADEVKRGEKAGRRSHQVDMLGGLQAWGAGKRFDYPLFVGLEM